MPECFYYYSNVSLCKVLDTPSPSQEHVWAHFSGPTCTMVSAQESGLAVDSVCT